MTGKEKRELKDGVISIFKRFNILDHTATIGGLRDDILRYINSLQEEPVSIDFEQKLYKTFGQIKDFTLGVAIAKRFYDMGRKYNEPVSEGLEEEIIRYVGYPQEVDEDISTTMIRKAARHFAKWQKEQMMAKAIDGKVIANGMGNPILHLWDKGRHLIDKKVKVIVIKED